MVLAERGITICQKLKRRGRQFSGMRLWQQYGAKLQHILSAYQERMLIFSAVAEIAAGFMLLQLMLHQPGQYLFMACVYCGLHLPARCLMPESAASPKQVWRVAASVARHLLRIDVVLEILVENLIRCHQWSLTTLTTF
ncbi:g2552 [Coccomyxa viridis]|uniref:G2552 protein n=1 Tax=Coccomyxa viridis TaxID=1274662 RepID=A0ABP1FKM4_9CHLO